MPSARGLVKCDGSRLVGTFDIDGSPRYLAVEVKPFDQSFECNNPTLIYNDVVQLVGDCKWTGTAGRDDLQMNFGGGVSIAGPLATPRSAIRIRGTGTWSTDPPIPANRMQDDVVSANPSPPHDAVRDAAKLVAREQQLLESCVPIIAIFGQSGTGKSTFINLIASEKQQVGKGLQPCTSEISVLAGMIGGQQVVIIDTPGIDDLRTGMDKTKVLVHIAEYLAEMGKRKVYVTGVLILHRINDAPLSQTAHRVNSMLKCLCGNTAMNNVMIGFTMWDRVSEDEGNERFDQLCETGAWKEMIRNGAGTAIISNVGSNAKEEAENVMTQLIKNVKPVKLAIQDEMVNQKLTVKKTSAGKVFEAHYRELQAETKREFKELCDSPRADCEANAAKAQDEIRVQEEESASSQASVFIAGLLATLLSTAARIRVVDRWNKIKSTLPLLSTNSDNGQRGDVGNVSANQLVTDDAVRDTVILRPEEQPIDLEVPIVAIFGQSGVGKSSFINLIASEQQKVGKGLQSCTSEIRAIEAEVGGQRVVVIDTPGIDDTRASVKESDVLTSIAKHLGVMGERKIYVTGVLILHRISDNKFSQTADRVSTVLKNLCGNTAMNHLMLCTTMWDRVPEDEGFDRFDELCDTGAWKEMIKKGAGTAMISNVGPNAKEEAKRIVSDLIKNALPVELAIQNEMVHQKLTVETTSAGKALDELQDTQAVVGHELKKTHNEMPEENEVDDVKRQEKPRGHERKVALLKGEVMDRAQQCPEHTEHGEKVMGQLNETKELLRKEGREATLAQLESPETSEVSRQEHMRQELLAREKKFTQLKQQQDELSRDLKAKDKRFKLERRNTVQAQETQKKEEKEATAQAAKATGREEAQQREINEIKKQVAALAKPQRSGSILRLFSLS